MRPPSKSDFRFKHWMPLLPTNPLLFQARINRGGGVIVVLLEEENNKSAIIFGGAGEG
jgi:hypothetical protein